MARAVESLAKETGDYVSDHLFATLRRQYEKGTSRAKAVKLAKNLFHKREAAGRIYDYLDDAARAALYELAEAEDVLQEEIEQLGKIVQTYQAEAGKTLTKTQLDDLIGDSTLGEKSVEEVVAGLVERNSLKPNLKELMELSEIPKYDLYWNSVADNIIKESIQEYRGKVLAGIIKKDTGGKINSRMLTGAIDMDTGEIYYGVSGMKNNPTRGEINSNMQILLKEVGDSMTNYSLENCSEFNAINNALNNGANIQSLRVYSIRRIDGEYADPCINCINLYGPYVHFVK